jgi:DNA-binding transcriptional MerR regulator/methylmalonyl-CoA mutase cobalamin-binding subunit
MNTYRIHRVSKISGLSKDVIRMWERRYGILRPERGANRYRIYTDEDVALLRYLKAEMDQGTAIGELAALGREELLRRVASRRTGYPAAETPYDRLLDELVASLDPFDPPVFERRLNGAVAVVPFEEALFGILLPLQVRVGELWHQSVLDVSIEHYVTRQIQQKLFAAMNQIRFGETGPELIVGCPPGEYHEVAAQAAAYLARVRGCSVAYLGSDVPVDALVAIRAKARADLVVLSYTGASPRENGRSWIKKLADEILPSCPVWIGGEGAQSSRALLESNRIEVMDSLSDFEERLRQFVSRHPAARKS